MAERRFAWARWVEPWYSAYGLTGIPILGIAPILISPTVADDGGGATAVVAAFYFGGLFAPMIGSRADRTGKERLVFLAASS